MHGYRVIYREPDGVITETFFGEPTSSFDLPQSDYLDVLKFMFYFAHPNCEIISIERFFLKTGSKRKD